MRFATELRERRAASHHGTSNGGAPRPPAPAGQPRWERATRDGAARLRTWIVQPQVRTVVIGVALIVISATVLNHSVWTLPILVVGIVMVVVAWVGRRLEGRFAIEWSDAGAGFEMRARFKAREPMSAGPAIPELELEPPIEGEAHTVEIDTGELRALIEAAERAERSGAAERRHRDAA